MANNEGEPGLAHYNNLAPIHTSPGVNPSQNTKLIRYFFSWHKNAQVKIVRCIISAAKIAGPQNLRPFRYQFRGILNRLDYIIGQRLPITREMPQENTPLLYQARADYQMMTDF